MLKKMRLDKDSIQATKAKAKEITWRIDKLLAMEEERGRNVVEMTTSYVTTSKVSRNNQKNYQQ